MNELIEFLKARLDEDERAARGLAGATTFVGGRPDFYGCGGPAAEAYWEHFPPHRELREVEAKRRIVDDYRIAVGAVSRATGPELDSPGYRAMRAGRDAFRSACVSLAAVYSDHPDFQPEWVTGSSASS
jgi:hypothetical protein